MHKRILIVDDSEDTRELLTATLECEGFVVLSASNGDEALELLSKDAEFSLVLLDLSMPSMTGLELLSEMQKRGVATEVPIMLVSAATNLEKIPVPPNVIDHLKKPFFYPELIFKIKERHHIDPTSSDHFSPDVTA
ncbi:MAG: response regulator [Bdellovibrionales bacterium]